MGAFTSRAGLYKPGGGSTGLILPDETVDIDKLNGNFDKIDALLGARNVPSASSYSGNMDGDLVYAQDTKFLQMYSAADSKLITPKLPGSNAYKGTKAQRDLFTDATEGDLWVLSDESKTAYVRRGSEWLPAPDSLGVSYQAVSLEMTDGWLVLTDLAKWSKQGAADLGVEWNKGIVIPHDGVYALSGGFYMAATPTLQMFVKRNNVQASIGGVVAGSSVPTTGTISTSVGSVYREMFLSKNDVITFAIYKLSGGLQGFTPSGTHIGVRYLRP